MSSNSRPPRPTSTPTRVVRNCSLRNGASMSNASTRASSAQSRIESPDQHLRNTTSSLQEEAPPGGTLKRCEQLNPSFTSRSANRRCRKVTVERPPWNSDTEESDGPAWASYSSTSSPVPDFTRESDTAKKKQPFRTSSVLKNLGLTTSGEQDPSTNDITLPPSMPPSGPTSPIVSADCKAIPQSRNGDDGSLLFAEQPNQATTHERSLQSDVELVWLTAKNQDLSDKASGAAQENASKARLLMAAGSLESSLQEQLAALAQEQTAQELRSKNVGFNGNDSSVHELDTRVLKLQEELLAQRVQHESERCSWQLKVKKKETELEAVAERQRLEEQRLKDSFSGLAEARHNLESEIAAFSEQQSEIRKREQDLSKREADLRTQERALQEQLAALAKEQTILEARSKNLGFNVKRRQNEVDQKRERLKKDAMQEVEAEQRKQKEEFEREKEDAIQKVELEKKKKLEEVEREKEAARIQALEQQEALDRETALALEQVEQEKSRVEAQKRKVEREKKEAMEVALGLKAPAPAHWRNQAMEPTLDVKVQCKRDSLALLELLRASARHTTCHGRDGVFEINKVKKVHAWRIENPILWRQYISKGEELRSRHKIMATSCEPVQPAVPEHVVPHMPANLKWCSSGNFDGATNEVLVWHGTKSHLIDTISTQGFDERVCSLSGMFGAGLYFAQDSCKSGQYAETDCNNSHWFLLCRVRLGRPYYATDAMQNIRKAPDGFDSVVFNPGTGHVPMGHHRELIVYDRYQAYPEYVVRAFQ